jgi:dihydrofolate synthase/folylpolyglutamate synthase
MTYDEAIEWLLSFADFERSGRFQDRPDVAPMLALLERLGNPHLGRPTVHIAGSKGKGSVAAMVGCILGVECPSCVGVYTSPHLYSYTERIARACNVGGSAEETTNAQEFLAQIVSRELRPVVDKMHAVPRSRELVTFDLLTALAFLDFDDAEVQVLEVGLGGRVDSTNVFETKEVAVITPISFEHTDILGDTIEEIAAEKAAIITPGCAAVMGRQVYREAETVIRGRARPVGAKLIDVDEEYHWTKVSHDARGQDLRIESPHGIFAARLALLGQHQADNALTACATVYEFIDRYDRLWVDGTTVPDAIVYGLANVRWPCRIEVIREDPLVIVDGAHNRDSARRLAETLVEYFACDRALFIIGCGSDKDVAGLAAELAPLASRVIAVRSEHPRAMDPQRIQEAFGRLNVDCEIVDNVPAAVDAAIAAVDSGALICVAGSLFVAAEARAHVLGTEDIS